MTLLKFLILIHCLNHNIQSTNSFSLNLKPTTALEKSIDIDCIHYGKCPGCITNNDIKNVEAVNRVKQYFTSNVINKHRITDPANNELFPIEIPSLLQNWRTQARIAIGPRGSWNGSGCILGLYGRGSHDVVSINECEVHDDRINEAMKLIEKATIKVRINSYDEIKLSGELRYVQIQIERRTGKVVLVLVWNGDKLKDCQPSISRLVKYLKQIAPSESFWHSIWCHCNTSPTNNIFARGESRWHLLYGPEYHTELLPGSTDKKLLFFKPMVFRQANLDGFSNIALKVTEFVPPNSKVCELYAGIGVIGLTVLNSYSNTLQSLKCSDENPSNEKCFYRSLNTILPKEENDNKVTYLIASASQALKQGEAFNSNVLIVDPPRKGLEEFVLSQLCLQRTKQKKKHRTDESATANYVNDVTTLIYVSCGYKALLRDCDKLLSSGGGWKISYSSGYILFPGSDHIETLVVFTR